MAKPRVKSSHFKKAKIDTEKKKERADLREDKEEADDMDEEDDVDDLFDDSPPPERADLREDKEGAEDLFRDMDDLFDISPDKQKAKGGRGHETSMIEFAELMVKFNFDVDLVKTVMVSSGRYTASRIAISTVEFDNIRM